MKFHVNEDDCIGCGQCSIVCPAVFSMIEGDIERAVAADREVTPTEAASAEQAMSNCPAAAIEQV